MYHRKQRKREKKNNKKAKLGLNVEQKVIRRTRKRESKEKSIPQRTSTNTEKNYGRRENGEEHTGKKWDDPASKG